MAKIAVITIVVPFSTAILRDSFVSATCICPNGRTWVLNEQCYCGAEADKIESCVRSKAPNWPFAGEKSAGNNPSAGFPKELSNASQIAEDCASQVKGQPGNDKGNGGGKTGGGNGGNPSSGGGGDGNGNSGGKDGAAGKPAIPPKSNC